MKFIVLVSTLVLPLFIYKKGKKIESTIRRQKCSGIALFMYKKGKKKKGKKKYFRERKKKYLL